jgi:hypothetical protein
MPDKTLPDGYAGPERRIQSRTIEEVEMAFDRKLRDHEEREQKRIKELFEELVSDAFPDGLVKHRDYHQSKIDAAKEEAEFWKAAKMELTKVGVSALAGVVKAVLVLAVVGLMYKLGLGAIVAATLPK